MTLSPRTGVELMSWLLAIAAGISEPKCLAADEPQKRTIVRLDTGRQGTEVPLQAGPQSGSSNYLKKTLVIDSLDQVRSANLQIFGALRAADGHFTWDRWKWIWFSLNGHQWVRRVEHVPLHRTRGDVDWSTVQWAPVKIPNIRYLKEGVNELTIWTNNPPEYGEAGRQKFLVVAVDDSGRSTHSFSWRKDDWTNDDLNGDREGSPQGEWMIRLALNSSSDQEQRAADAIGRARLRKAIEEKQDFVWGFTDALHRVFPDRPYTAPLGNAWTIDAARNEYESCQLVVIPASVDMDMAEVFVGDFVALPSESSRANAPAVHSNRKRISRKHVTVRLVRTARTGGIDWPDPLPLAHPVDIAAGGLQTWWLTVHVPEDAQPGLYRSEVTITSMTSGGKNGEVTRVPLQLRVRNFAIPTVSRYQIVGSAHPEMLKWQITPASSYQGPSRPRVMLDRDDNLKLDFTELDKRVEAQMAAGKDTFSIGLSYTGAGEFAAWMFDWRVPVEGEDGTRRIWVAPVIPGDLDAKQPDSRQSRKWFRQYLTQFYNHLEEKKWTKNWWIYAADEPHRAEWREPLKRYFAIIHECAPKLRIMTTREPTDEFGPHLNVACVMINHLQSDSHKVAARLKQELWCYSCGHLNNPALTLHESPVDIRTWFWLQEKWNVRRVLLWQTSVWGNNFHQPGADGRGDGQVFYFRPTQDGESHPFPSIRAEMLRDGVEDREYFVLLNDFLTRNGVPSRSPSDHATLSARAAELVKVPDAMVRTQYEMSGDVQQLLTRRARMADVIDAIQALPGHEDE